VDFVSALTLAATTFMVTLSGALMPGPVLGITISESAKKGAWVGPLVILGHAIVEVPMMCAILLGLGIFLRSEMASVLIGFFGGSALIVLGYLTAKPAYAGDISLSDFSNSGKVASHGSIFGGMLTSISNPWFPLWWVMVGGSLLAEALKIGWVGIVAFIVGHWGCDLGWYSLVSLSVAKGRRIMSPGIYRLVVASCGVFIAALGMFFLLSGLDALRTIYRYF